RKRTAYGPTERVATRMAERAIARAGIALLLIDVAEGPSEQDARLASEIAEGGNGLIVVLSKVDLRDQAALAKVRGRLSDELGHVDWAPVVETSAKTGHHIERVLAVAREVDAELGRRVPTAELNRWLAEVLGHHPPPV